MQVGGAFSPVACDGDGVDATPLTDNGTPTTLDQFTQHS
jgi:hypothetical protein